MNAENLAWVIAATVLVGVAMWLFYWLLGSHPVCTVCGEIVNNGKQFCSEECHQQWIKNEIIQRRANET